MGEEKYGKYTESVEEMMVDYLIPTKSGVAKVGGEIDRIPVSHKVSHDLVLASNQRKNKDKNESNVGLMNEDEEEIEMSLVISNAKRRKSDIGLEENMDPQSGTSTIMAVGLVDQVHRSQ